MGSAKRGADTTRSSRQTDLPCAFPKSVRLRKRREFLAVQNSGKKFSGRYFLALVSPRAASAMNPSERSTGGRVGVTVTKKIGNAVTRNRIKRLVREYVRQSQWLDMPVETVLIARNGAQDLTGYHQVAADLDRIYHSIARRGVRGESGEGRRPRGERREPSSC